MSKLTSSVPGAVKAFYDLLVTQGAAQSTPVSVFLADLNMDEPDSYVMLGSTPSGREVVENWTCRWAASGAQALYEEYEICGFATVWAGNFDPVSRLADTFDLFQSVVMDTFVNYDGGYGSIGGFGSQILGSAAPTSLEKMVLGECAYQPQAKGSGTAGVVEFCFEMMARLTV